MRTISLAGLGRSLANRDHGLVGELVAAQCPVDSSLRNRQERRSQVASDYYAPLRASSSKAEDWRHHAQAKEASPDGQLCQRDGITSVMETVRPGPPPGQASNKTRILDVSAEEPHAVEPGAIFAYE